MGADGRDGIVPAEQGGSDAPRELLDDDPQLGSDVLGAGDRADAVTDGGPDVPEGVEPDMKDAAAAAREAAKD